MAMPLPSYCCHVLECLFGCNTERQDASREETFTGQIDGNPTGFGLGLWDADIRPALAYDEAADIVAVASGHARHAIATIEQSEPVCETLPPIRPQRVLGYRYLR